VERITHGEAEAFLETLAAKTGLAFGLPTEAQWEYACRAGTTTAFNNGKDVNGHEAEYSPELAELGRHRSNCNDGKKGWIHVSNSILSGNNGCEADVGQYLPNAWGLYDMHGNVCEWCADWYADNLGTREVTDPMGPASGTERVYRGGNWQSYPEYCRSASRFHSGQRSCSEYIGFRPCCIGER
jgi:formylglycine-generating enzyme required for sulfatase activity